MVPFSNYYYNLLIIIIASQGFGAQITQVLGLSINKHTIAVSPPAEMRNYVVTVHF